MPGNPREAVAVITGASSGIGRATALEFARHGTSVVLAARRQDLLHRLAGECVQAGGQALAAPTDITDAEAVTGVARAAVECFGRIDVWVNNAGAILFSRFGEEPVEDARRVIEVNVLGYLYGARAALPWFREQGEGVLINVGSVLSCLPSPYLAPYVISKHAALALSACLRTELLGAPGIRVSTVMPGSVDTPLYQHAANHTGWALDTLDPTYPPERVARAIVSCARHRRGDVFVGWAPRMAALQHTVAPWLTERLAMRTVRRGHFTDQPAEHTSGNLFQPMTEGDTASGGWRGGPSSVARRVALGAALALIGLQRVAVRR